MTSDNLLLKSVKRRQKDGPRELAELLNKEDAAQKKREELNAFHSRAWNLRKKQMREAKKPEAAEDEEQQALPEGWRCRYQNLFLTCRREKKAIVWVG